MHEVQTNAGTGSVDVNTNGCSPSGHLGLRSNCPHGVRAHSSSMRMDDPHTEHSNEAVFSSSTGGTLSFWHVRSSIIDSQQLMHRNSGSYK